MEDAADDVRERDCVEAHQERYKNEQVLHVGAGYTVHLGGGGEGEIL